MNAITDPQCAYCEEYFKKRDMRFNRQLNEFVCTECDEILKEAQRETEKRKR